MRRFVWLAAMGAGLALAACGDPMGQAAEPATAPTEAGIIAPSAGDQSVPAADTGAATDMQPADSTDLPPEQRSSEQTVQPESETLFY